MECRAVIDSLSDYLDAPKSTEMKDSERHAIEDHLGTCPTCQSLKLEFVELKTAARELPLHTPPRAMWVRIANTLEAELPASERKTREEFPKETWWDRLKARQFTLSFPQMAGVAALVIAFIVYGIWGVSDRNVSPGKMSFADVQSAFLPDEEQIKTELNRRLVEINKHKSNWAPQARAAFEEQLLKIETSLQSCREQLRSNPDDATHQQKLRGMYEEKRRLLDNAERQK